VLDAVGAPSAHIAGWSMGGMIVQAMAIRHPERVLSMTSVMSAPGPIEGERDPDVTAVFTAPAGRTREEAAERHLAGLRAWGSPACYDVARITADAHAAYDRASQGQAAQLAPADVHEAHVELTAADQSFEKNGDTQETRDLAYAAKRKAELADVRAVATAAAKQQADAQAQLQQLEDQQVRLTSAELSTAQQQLATQGLALATAEQQRADAERRARQASADLARIASVKQEPRGMVITLSGGVLFTSAKSDLLPQAQAKLSEVADVLTRQDKDSKIVVQGYTDSQGSTSFNQELSQRRADAVRTYLVSHGMAADRITAQGFGPGNPVADNASPEGRADNRRVEIVVQPATTSPKRVATMRSSRRSRGRAPARNR